MTRGRRPARLWFTRDTIFGGKQILSYAEAKSPAHRGTVSLLQHVFA